MAEDLLDHGGLRRLDEGDHLHRALALRADVLFGLVDDLPGLGHPGQPREAEGAAGHVANQTLDASPVARRQVHRLVDTGAAVRPTPQEIENLGA